jgi:hypothetical protein
VVKWLLQNGANVNDGVRNNWMKKIKGETNEMKRVRKRENFCFPSFFSDVDLSFVVLSFLFNWVA